MPALPLESSGFRRVSQFRKPKIHAAPGVCHQRWWRIQSSANWLLPPESADAFKSLRDRFGALAKQWGLVGRLRSHTASASREDLFSQGGIAVLRSELVSFLHDQNLPCCDTVAPGQPFLLNCWAALGALTRDPDCSLPHLLQEGVATGIEGPIPPSGVWEQAETCENLSPELEVHRELWKSAQLDPAPDA